MREGIHYHAKSVILSVNCRFTPAKSGVLGPDLANNELSLSAQCTVQSAQCRLTTRYIAEPSKHSSAVIIKPFVMSVVDASFLIEKFNLLPHPEGGFYKETFRSEQAITFNDNESGELSRVASTAIYFLVVPGSVSRFHRIKSDEGKRGLLYFFHENRSRAPFIVDISHHILFYFIDAVSFT